MSNSQWMERLQGENGTESEPVTKADELQDLLQSIVAQISDADRRHSDTLSQMQDRISLLGSEARLIRARVPDQFQAAFERIETGMSELASRIAEVAQLPANTAMDMAAPMHVPAKAAAPDPVPSASVQAPQTPAATAPAFVPSTEAPMPLKSAIDPAGLPRRRDEEYSRTPAGVDPFDVIESIPGDVTNPWDQDAADALAGVYDTHDKSFSKEPAPRFAEPVMVPEPAATPAPPRTPATGSSADQAWLEEQFSGIAKGIERALEEIRPDQSFFAIGQRLDQFERQFGQAFEALATRQDVEAVRLIEAHMVELVDHLEKTAAQLSRLDNLEFQLTSISAKLEELQQFAVDQSQHSFTGDQQGPLDVAAIAKAAAQETASHFSSMPQADNSDHALEEMRSLFDRTLSEVRQGDENTVALLDTLQQAMIRLLDRVDAIELNQHAAAAEASPQSKAAPARSHAPAARPDLDAAVASVAAPNSSGSRFEPEPEFDRWNEPTFSNPAEPARKAGLSQGETRARSPDQVRQDFVAEARRAKLRLAAEEVEDEDPDSVIVRPAVAIETPVNTRSAQGAKATKVEKSKDAAPKSRSAVSPRVVALSLALLLAGGGAWFFMPGKSKRVTAAAPAKVEQAAKAKTEGAAVPAAPVQKQASGNEEAGEAAPPPDANFGAPAAKTPELNLHSTTGEIVPGNGAVVPLQGVSIATDGRATVADIEHARRQKAYATVSTKLGAAAADSMVAATATALTPDMTNVVPEASSETIAHTGKSALDLPPATVGPLSLRLAAAQGDPSAEFEVGARLAEGKGTDQNFKDAAKWYQRSASKGFVQAQYRLGTLYERGLGLKADTARAEEWYKRAAEQGNIKAMHNLAVLSANNRGASPDYPKAAEWFTQAAERGLADSQFNLAVLYENGLGVPEDLKQSYKWLALAARGGDKEAIRRRDILKGKLTANDLTAAEGMVSTFRAKAADKMANDARAAGEAWKSNPANKEPG